MRVREARACVEVHPSDPGRTRVQFEPMGFLDKAKQTLQDGAKAAQGKLDDATAKRKSDALLRELGAWTFAKHKGGFPDADANIERVLGELAAHEAEHGPLGAVDEPGENGDTASAPPPPPPQPSEPVPPPPPPQATAPPEVPGSTSPPPPSA
jgi:hypothetical protein